MEFISFMLYIFIASLVLAFLLFMITKLGGGDNE